MKKIYLLLTIILSFSLHSYAQCNQNCSLGNELLANGNFSLGNTSFQSDLSYNSSCAYASYDVNTNALNKCSVNTWESVADHTTGNGNFLIIDGPSLPNQDIWYKQISVTPGETYTFSYWVYPSIDKSSYTGYSNRPYLNLMVNTTTIDSFNANGKPVAWTQRCASYTVPNGITSIILKIRQVNPGSGSGYDYGIDDISLKKCNSNEDPCDFSFKINTTRQACRIQFSYTGSTLPPSITLLNMTWQFGDGESDTGFSVEHFYHTTGTFTVTATAVLLNKKTGECCVVRATRRIAVESICKGCRLDKIKVLAQFNKNDCSFDFKALNQSPTEIIGYFWDFGDGTSSSSPNPTHQYNAPGTYTVCLTVVGWTPNETGCCVRKICIEIDVPCKGLAQSSTDQKTPRSTLSDDKTEPATVLYPNPASSSFTITTHPVPDGILSIQMINTNGQLIKTFADHTRTSSAVFKQTFSVKGVSPGQYFIVITQNGKRETHHLIIN